MTAKKKKTEAATQTLTLTEELAIGVAHGSAGSAVECLRAQAAEPTDKLPRGQFWFAGGDVVPGLKTIEAHVSAMGQFVDQHDELPAHARYAYVRQDLLRKPIEPFDGLPVSDRVAFQVFVSQLPPLMAAVRAEKKAAERAAQLSQPPPNRGVYKRVKRGRKRLSDKVKLSRPVALKLEAAE